MEKYRDMNLKKKSALKMLRNIVFFSLLIVFTFWFIFKDQNLNEIIKTISSVNIVYVILGALVMFMVLLTESYNIKCILKTLGEKKISILKTLKFTFIGYFFSAITPAATGGQPVEIYYMTKDNVKAANGTLAMMLELCGYQISIMVISIICAITHPSILKDGLVYFYLIGITLNGIALSFMLIGIFSKKLTKKIINLVIKILKISRVKNIEMKVAKIEEGLAQYNESALFVRKHKGEFVKSILRVFIQVVLLHSVTYFTYKSFGLSEHNYIQVFSMQAILYTTAGSIPLPGAVGITEALFLKIFGLVFSLKIISSAMLVNRFISFYFYVIVSAIIFFVNAVRTKNTVGEIDKTVDEIDKD